MVKRAIALGIRLSLMLKGDGLRARLLRGGVGSVVIKIAATGLAFLVTITLARMLGPDGYGIYAYVLALISLLAIPAEFGLPSLVVRETAKAQLNKQWGLMRGIWRWASVTAGTISFALIFCAGVLAFLYSDRFSYTQLSTFGLGLVLIPLIALGNLRGAALRGLRKVVLGQLPEAVFRPAFLLIFCLGAYLISPTTDFTPTTAMGFNALAAVLAFGIGAVMLMRARPSALKSAPKPEYEDRGWLLAAAALGMLAAMQLINQQMDILILGIFRPAEEVGVYRIVVQGGMLITLGLHIVNQTIAPYVAQIYAHGSMEDLQRVAAVSSLAVLATALLVAIPLIVWPESILTIVFGPDYSVGHEALAILAIGKLLSVGLFGPVVLLLNMTGHEQQSMRSAAVAAVVNIILNLILIPKYGINGAATSTALALIIWHVSMWRSIYQKLGINSTPFYFIKYGN